MPIKFLIGYFCIMLIKELKNRIQLRRGIQTENGNGGFDLTYQTINTIWASVNQVSAYINAIRGEQIEKRETHEFLIRKNSVELIGREFDNSFSIDFKKMGDLNSLKSDYFIFLQQGSVNRGRLFRIQGIKQDEKNKEYIKIGAEELEEQGTGYAG